MIKKINFKCLTVKDKLIINCNQAYTLMFSFFMIYLYTIILYNSNFPVSSVYKSYFFNSVNKLMNKNIISKIESESDVSIHLSINDLGTELKKVKQKLNNYNKQGKQLRTDLKKLYLDWINLIMHLKIFFRYNTTQNLIKK